MRKMTFAGFLGRYVYALSLAHTNSISRLAAEAASVNSRLTEPLLLYALFADKVPILASAVQKTRLQGEYDTLLDRYDRNSMEAALQGNDPDLPERYRKVYQSYLNQQNRIINDDDTKNLMRDRILRMQQEKGVSNYRIYTDLGLNHGNINAFLKNGDCRKVSLDTARRTVKYLESKGCCEGIK